MTVSVNLQTLHPRKLAAVRCEILPGAAWGPALGKVWPFIRSQPGEHFREGIGARGKSLHAAWWARFEEFDASIPISPSTVTGCCAVSCRTDGTVACRSS